MHHARRRALVRMAVLLGAVVVVPPGALIAVNIARASPAFVAWIPSLCPSAASMPKEVRPYDCEAPGGPGGFHHKASADVTLAQFKTYVAALKTDRPRRLKNPPCRANLSDDGREYVETYRDAWVRVVWLDGTATYTATDVVRDPCQDQAS